MKKKRERWTMTVEARKQFSLRKCHYCVVPFYDCRRGRMFGAGNVLAAMHQREGKLQMRMPLG